MVPYLGFIWITNFSYILRLDRFGVTNFTTLRQKSARYPDILGRWCSKADEKNEKELVLSQHDKHVPNTASVMVHCEPLSSIQARGNTLEDPASLNATS